VLGAAYRGGVKETAFSGVFGAVEALAQRGAIPVVHDSLYTDEELVGLGFTPYHLGEEVDAAVVQADHDEYRSLSARDLPGISAFIDGRRVSSAEQWPGVAYRVIGKAIA
jgi:UDP-N-acetyl-D-mannosaminuronate dehydrogenase